jgi:hypothetical protein
VYADDFVMCFQRGNEAREPCKHLRHRLDLFGLRLAEEKRRLIEFGKSQEENAQLCIPKT